MALFLGISSLTAHPDPLANIEEFNQQIAAGDTRPEIYYARGLEYRAIDRLDEAVADFRMCLAKAPEHLGAHMDLSRVQLVQEKYDDAFATIQNALKLAANKPMRVRAAAWVQLAEIELARMRYQPALDATTEALKLVPKGEIGWYLLRGAAQKGLGHVAEGIADLKAGFDTLQSSVLRVAWLDALIDADRGAEALAIVESEMAECRYKAEWLIRRARIRLAEKKTRPAQEDLHAAIAELDEHILPDEPDPSLVIDRGIAHFWLGDVVNARKDLDKAAEIWPEMDVLQPLADLLKVKPVLKRPGPPAAPADSSGVPAPNAPPPAAPSGSAVPAPQPRKEPAVLPPQPGRAVGIGPASSPSTRR